VFMFGSDAPLRLDEPAIRQVLGAEAAVRDLNDVPDHPPTDADGWVRAVRRAEWLADGQVRAFAGPGHRITDDRPRSEYFLWRRALMDDRTYVDEDRLRAAARP
jgi:hypothetical protein